MEPAPEMLMSLLPFQKEFLAWAVDQERSEIRGGILADEMGMGKTIQVPPAPQAHIPGGLGRDAPPGTPYVGCGHYAHPC